MSEPDVEGLADDLGWKAMRASAVMAPTAVMVEARAGAQAVCVYEIEVYE